MSRRIVMLLSIGLSAAVVVAEGESDAPAAGVFIAHHPAGLVFSAGTDWCLWNLEGSAIDSCTKQQPRIDVDYPGQSAVWFVLVAFTDSTAWGGTEFGFGTYNRASFLFTDHGPCFPEEGLEIPMTGWPGPNQGTAFVTTGDEPWRGSIQPVYYFAGYAYAADLIPLDVNPQRGFGGTCTTHAVERPAEAFGAMGLLQDGVAVCPETPPTDVGDPSHRDSQTLPPTPMAVGTHGIPDPVKMKANLDKYPPEVIEFYAHTTLAPALGLHNPAEGESPLLASGTLQVSGGPGVDPTISFTLLADARVSVRVFDFGFDGRFVCTPLDSSLARGTHEIPLEYETPRGKPLRSGVYSVHLEINGVASGDRIIGVGR